MKKKILSILTAVVLLAAMAACSGGGSESRSSKESQSSSSQQPQSSDSSKSQEAPTESKDAAYEITYQNSRTYTNSIGTTWVQTIVEITNTGDSNLYLSSGAYDLEDTAGSLVASKKMVSEYPSVLAPGEKGYMYDETILDDYTGDGNLTVLPRPDVEKAKVELIRYNVSDVSVSDDTYGGLKVMGRIENQTSETEDSMIYIVAFFYDEADVPIGSAFTILTEDLAAGDKIGFELNGLSLPDDVTSDAVAKTVVYAYPMQMQF